MVSGGEEHEKLVLAGAQELAAERACTMPAAYHSRVFGEVRPAGWRDERLEAAAKSWQCRAAGCDVEYHHRSAMVR